MNVQTQETPAPPIGVVESLTRGFETVNNCLWLLLLPLSLDLFLWLGPHLSIETLVQQMIVGPIRQLSPDPATRQAFNAALDLLTAFGQQFNLFSRLDTAPFGLPSLMAGRGPLASPAGPATTIPITSPALYLLILVCFYLAGLLLGAMYLDWIARQVRGQAAVAGEAPPEGDRVQRVAAHWARFLIINLLLLVVAAVIGAPLLLATALLSALSPLLAQFALAGVLVVALWALVYVSFTLHGVVLAGQGVRAALWDSVRMVQWNLLSTLGLFTVMLAVSRGLNTVWNMPGDQSWYLLIGVAGHAYIATGLTTASFVFYVDRSRWWREARAQFVASLQRDQARASRRQ
ncbi:MAG: hypothetical protein HY784_02430 [Chloroflexi bacterium]|nr:hypothetical protein [Chloroflexota bacterium]